MGSKFLLVNEDDFQKLLADISEIKHILISKNQFEEKPMNTADVLEYLKISRRTLLMYQKQRLQASGPGRNFFYKKDIDQFIYNNPKNNTYANKNLPI